MKNYKTTLLVLDETERSLIVEALHNYIEYNFPVHLFYKDSEKKRLKMIDLLDSIKIQSGGFRMITTEDNIDLIAQALRWNSKFILSEKERNNIGKMDEYTELSYVLDGRNKNIYLFKDFDPKEYALNTKVKTIPKFDFTQKRIFLIRFENNEMEFVREFYRNKNEKDEQYTGRVEQAVSKYNEDCVAQVKYNKVFLDMKYQAVTFDEVKNFKLKKSFSYNP